MKRLLLSILVCALAAGAVALWFGHPRTAPSISVWLQDDTGGGGGLGIPAVDNYSSGDHGTDGFYASSGTYRVVSNPAGKFFVLAHYQVTHGGKETNFDLCLPVLEKQPAKSGWTPLDQHLSAVAYYDGGTMNY